MWAGETSHVPIPPTTITISVTSANRLAPCSAMITPMNTNGIVLSIRCGQLTCMNGAVKMPQMWSKLRGRMPSLSRLFESSVLITSMNHMSTTIPASSGDPFQLRLTSTNRGTGPLAWNRLLMPPKDRRCLHGQ